RRRQGGPGLLRQRIEIRLPVEGLVLAHPREDIFLETPLLDGTGHESDVLGEAADHLDVRDEQAERVGPDLRLLLPNQGKDPEAKQQMVYVFDQTARLRVVLEVGAGLASIQTSVTGKERLQEQPDR